MTQEEFLKEFVALPPEGQRVVADLIAFLRERYGVTPAVERSEVSDIASERFIGMWSDRDEMKDSSAWVRRTREEGITAG